jgi:hypothetical protein
MRKFLTLATTVVLLASCGDKVPESKAAKEVGNIPKQAIDKASAGVNDAMGKSAERLKEQDEKKQ